MSPMGNLKKLKLS